MITSPWNEMYSELKNSSKAVRPILAVCVCNRWIELGLFHWKYTVAPVNWQVKGRGADLIRAGQEFHSDKSDQACIPLTHQIEENHFRHITEANMVVKVLCVEYMSINIA